MASVCISRQCIGQTQRGVRCRHYTTNPNGWCGQCIAPAHLVTTDSETTGVTIVPDFIPEATNPTPPVAVPQDESSHRAWDEAPPLSVTTTFGRCYLLPPDTETLYPSVTAICHLASGDTDSLDAWRVRVTAQVALSHADELARLPDDATRLRAITQWAQEATQAAANRGSRIHAALAAWATGQPLPPLQDGDQADFEALQHWVAHNVQAILGVEQTVFCTKGAPYAGTADLRCKLINGETAVIDYKTGSYVNDRAFAMQLAAYANADTIVDQDGTRHPAPPVDRLIVLQASGGSVAPRDYTRCRKEALDLFQQLAASAAAVVATPKNQFEHRAAIVRR